MDHPRLLHSSDGQQPHGRKSNESSNRPSVEECIPGRVIGMEQHNVVEFSKRRLKLMIRMTRQKTESWVSNSEASDRGGQQNPAGGRSQVAGNKIETQIKGPEQAKRSKETTDCAIQKENVVKEIQINAASSNNRDLPQPLSICLDESILPLVADDKGVSSNDRPTSQSIKAITWTDSPIKALELQKSSAIVVESTLMVRGTPTDTEMVEEIGDTVNECDLSLDQLPPKSESWPFLKQSPVWEFVESWKVFEVMPQKPHFHPLEQYPMDLREGHAIGGTLNFANLVEKITDRKVDEPTSVLQDMLEALPKLEALGFNVEPIQARLKDLLRIKNKQDQLNEEFMAAEEHFEKAQHDEEELEMQLDMLANKIKELQQSLQSLNKEKEFIAMQKQINDSCVSELKSTVDATKRPDRQIKTRF